MSKKIRVGWDDLKPGDLIHVKGSTNTYRFKSRTDWHSMIKVEGRRSWCLSHMEAGSRKGTGFGVSRCL